MIRDQSFFVIPGRSHQRANRNLILQTKLGIPGPARCAVPD
jgi:hypothetical protein